MNENTIKLMSEENCIVYACRQAGVDENTLDFIKESMTTRFFPESKLNYILKKTLIKRILNRLNSQIQNIQ